MNLSRIKDFAVKVDQRQRNQKANSVGKLFKHDSCVIEEVF